MLVNSSYETAVEEYNEAQWEGVRPHEYAGREHLGVLVVGQVVKRTRGEESLCGK